MAVIESEKLLILGARNIHQLIRQKPGENASGQITLATIHVSFPMFASVLEGAFLDASGYLVLYGFRGKHFVAWNETNQREILAVDCGGAHRTWDFAPASDAANGGCLIWTQASKIHRYSQSDITYRIAQNGTHGREINALAYWPIFAAVPGSGLRLLATGAEDTTIRIAVIRNEVDGLRASETGPFDHLAVLKKHTTGIQALQWSCCGKYLFSSGGSEEFFVWRVRQIPMLGLGVVWEARCHRQDEVCDARITNFDARPVLSLGCQPAGRFLISMAYSDSTVRLFFYDCKGISVENAEICLQESRPSCEGPPASVERKKIKIHQSSILCAKSIQIGAESLLFVSGGEDNAVGLAWIHRDEDVPGKISSATLLIPKAHACAVTSIAVVPSHPSIEPSANGRRRHLMATSGPDQRLKVWSITLDPENPDMSNVDVTLEHEEHSSVADASAADSYVEGSSRKIAICGVGIETWALDTSL
ncbi:MAG: hypothetical protein M1815_004949 [Lichina confinis]|nr:MAG: hypothetical protein M1815_004949 [Lichina confinis]